MSERCGYRYKCFTCDRWKGHAGKHQAGNGFAAVEWPKEVGIPAEAVERYEHARQKASEIQQGGSHYCKSDSGKLRYDLIPPAALERVVSVLTKGADKHGEGYGEINWRRGAEYTRLYAAVQRHLKDWYKGEEIDADTDEPHLACAISDLLMLLDIQQSKTGKDDRPFRQEEP